MKIYWLDTSNVGKAVKCIKERQSTRTALVHKIMQKRLGQEILTDAPLSLAQG